MPIQLYSQGSRCLRESCTSSDSHQTHLSFSLSNRKGVEGERNYLAVKPSNKRLSRAFLMGSKGAWRSGATTVKLRKLNSRAVKIKRNGDTEAFPFFLGNNEQILENDYTVTPAAPALKSVLDRRCSYLPSD